MDADEFAKIFSKALGRPGQAAVPHMKRFGDRMFVRQPDGSWKPADDEPDPDPQF